jgi:hypothetical protein
MAQRLLPLPPLPLQLLQLLQLLSSVVHPARGGGGTVTASPVPTASWPATNHVGRWTAPPRAIESGHFPDAPILGNGDLGVSLGADPSTGELALYLGLVRADDPACNSVTPPPAPRPHAHAHPPPQSHF